MRMARSLTIKVMNRTNFTNTRTAGASHHEFHDGWRARAALKAARLRQQADAAVKAATESLEVLDVGAKVASAANAAAETAKQAQVRAR